jgi:hypothetical protein
MKNKKHFKIERILILNKIIVLIVLLVKSLENILK